jgi:hypothetical protein
MPEPPTGMVTVGLGYKVSVMLPLEGWISLLPVLREQFMPWRRYYARYYIILDGGDSIWWRC